MLRHCGFSKMKLIVHSNKALKGCAMENFDSLSSSNTLVLDTTPGMALPLLGTAGSSGLDFSMTKYEGVGQSHLADLDDFEPQIELCDSVVDKGCFAQWLAVDTTGCLYLLS